MGSVFTEDSALMNKTYIIGFKSYGGTAGRTFEKTYRIQKPKSEGFENWMNKRYKYAFVDFKNYNILHPSGYNSFYMKCSMTSPYHRDEEAQWTKIFDGVFYIREMYHCKK
jgi:erythromycin esterase-like protein